MNTVPISSDQPLILIPTVAEKFKINISSPLSIEQDTVYVILSSIVFIIKWGSESPVYDYFPELILFMLYFHSMDIIILITLLFQQSVVPRLTGSYQPTFQLPSHQTNSSSYTQVYSFQPHSR
jgi:hypothetical protein